MARANTGMGRTPRVGAGVKGAEGYRLPAERLVTAEVPARSSQPVMEPTFEGEKHKQHAALGHPTNRVSLSPRSRSLAP